MCENHQRSCFRTQIDNTRNDHISLPFYNNRSNLKDFKALIEQLTYCLWMCSQLHSSPWFVRIVLLGCCVFILIVFILLLLQAKRLQQELDRRRRNLDYRFKAYNPPGWPKTLVFIHFENHMIVFIILYHLCSVATMLPNEVNSTARNFDGVILLQANNLKPVIKF